MKIDWLSSIFLLFLMIFSTGLIAQDCLVPYLKQGKWGYANKNAEIVIQPRYDSVVTFYNDVAEVFLKGKVGVIDRNGDYVIKPKYNHLYWGRYYKNNSPFIIVSKNNKYGVIDTNENVIIPLKHKIESKYNVHHYNQKGDTITFFSTQGKKYMFDPNYQLIEGKNGLDGSGSEAITMEQENNYPNYHLIQKGNKFGVSIESRKYNSSTRSYSIVTTIIEPKYDSINLIDTLHKVVYVQQNDKWGVINEKNESILPIEYQEIKYVKSNDFFVKENDKWGEVKLVEDKITYILPSKYTSLEKSHESWNYNYIATINKQRYYIFRSNTSLEIPLYDYKTRWITRFDNFEVVEVVTKDGQIGYIGKNGKYFFEE